MKLLLVRHGELIDDHSDVLHGANDPVSLSDTGKETMLSLIPLLKKYETEVIFTSSETRTTESAELVASELSIEVIKNAKLQGRSWGDYGGKTWKEVGEILSRKNLEDRYTFTPPNGESWKDFESRILSELTDIINIHASDKKTICILTHGSVIRVLAPKLFGMSTEKSLKMYPAYGSINSIEWDGTSYVNPEIGTMIQ